MPTTRAISARSDPKMVNHFPRCGFIPWVGSDYQCGISEQRVLILGESHYGAENEADKRTFTIKVLEELATGESRHAFFTKVLRAFVVDDGSERIRSSFWSSVAFYNYVQSFVGDGPRIAPTKQAWIDAAQPFQQVLDELQPSKIFVLGYRLWVKLPPGMGEGPTLGDVPLETWWYRHAGGKALAVRLPHPASGGFSPDRLRSSIGTALES